MAVLDKLKKQGLSYPYIERCLSLPQGTIAGWDKKGKYPKDGLALMEIVNLFPWMLEVADDGFKNPEGKLLEQVEITIRPKQRKIGFNT